MDNHFKDQINLAMEDFDTFLKENPDRSTEDWLQSKWDKIPDGIDSDHSYDMFNSIGDEYEVQIPLNLIVASSHNALWGDLDYRRDNYVRITDAALMSYKNDQNYDQWFHKMFERDHIGLGIAASTKHGNLYRINSNGNHRLHVLKAMGITAPIPVLVTPQEDSEYISASNAFGDYRVFEMLVRMGYLEPAGENDRYQPRFKVLEKFPSWITYHKDVEFIVEISSKYKEHFPNFGNDKLEKILLDKDMLEEELESMFSSNKLDSFIRNIKSMFR